MNPLYYLAAIPIFGVLVIVHEFGHFIMAKWAGIRVEEFSIGFPPRLFGIKRGETLYSINLLPIGGFVRMPGENGDAYDENGNIDPRSFGAKSAGRRFIVLIAGVTMNLILAVVLFTAAEAVGQVDYLPVIQKVEASSPAQAAGIQPGDHILAVDGHSIKTWSDLITQVSNDVNKVPAGAVSAPITLLDQHKGAAQPVTIVVNARTHPTAGQGALGVFRADETITLRHPLWQAPIRGVQDIGTVAQATVQGVHDIIRGAIPVGQAVSGPVGIAKVSAQAASSIQQTGWYFILFLTGFLSLNLAFFNLLPIPGLDGGRLLFIVIEVLRRGKRVSPEREALVHTIGLAALLFLVLLVTINDVSNLGH